MLDNEINKNIQINTSINFIACYEEFQKHFPAEVVDHYDDVYQVGRKAVEF